MNRDDLKREAERIVNEICEKFDEKFITDQFIDVVFNALRSVRDKALEEAEKIANDMAIVSGSLNKPNGNCLRIAGKIRALKSKAGEDGR